MRSRSSVPRGAVLLAGLAFALTQPLVGQRPLNLDFERAGSGDPFRPWGWSLGWSAFAGGPPATFVLDSTTVAQGHFALRIAASDTAADAPARAMMLQLPAADLRGKRLRLTGRLRARDLMGRAVVSLEAWGDRVVPAGDSVVATSATTDASDGWHPFTLSIRVPVTTDIHSVVFVAGVQGRGTAWYDDMHLAVNDVAVTALPAPPPPTAAQIAWLAKRSVPLLATWSGATRPSDPDFALFDRIVGKATLIGLGESTHGTRQFFQLKDRLIRHLVERRSVRVFAIEANQLAVRRLDDYVQGGPGDAPTAMRVLFNVWYTEEMLELVDWLRSHNALHPDQRVHVVGYDMQDHRLPIDSLRAFVARTSPDLTERVAAWTAGYRAQSSYATPAIPEVTRAAWSAAADSLHVEVLARRGAWLAAARTRDDTLATEWAVHAAELLRQAARFNVALNSPERDSLMAANLDWALRTLYPATRTVVWAHDLHVSRGGDRTRSFNGGAQMGAHLAKTYHHDYRAFSLLTRFGTYRATRSLSDYTMVDAEAFPAPTSSVEGVLARLRRPEASVGALTDLRVAARDPRGAWLWRPRPIRSIGYAAYDYGFEMLAVMPLEFDGVFFVDRSSASHGLR